MATSNGKPSPGFGFVIGALVVGGVIGFAIGRGGGGKGGTTVPSPVPTTPGGRTEAPTPTPTVVPTGYNSGASCYGPDTKNIWVYDDGSNSCQTNDDGSADVFPANGGTVNWNSGPGTTLVIVFKTTKAFPHLYCGLNACSIGLADTTYHLTPQPYVAYVYGRGTPTPKPGTPTPVVTPQGRIIIKP